MNMAVLRGVFATVIVFSVFSSTLCNSHFVPVLIWQSPSLGNALPLASAVDKLTRSEFEADLVDIANSRGPIVFFLQDDLSLEDFTIWGHAYDQNSRKNAFVNIKTLLDNNNSSMLPAVESPEDSIPVIANGRSIFEVKANSYPTKESLENSLVIYRLPNTASASDRQKALSKNDEIIGDFIAKLSADSPLYTAIYTSEHSAWADVEEEHVRISRAALSLGETNENNTYYHNASNCYIIYIEDMSFDFYNLTDKDSSSYSKISHPLIGDYTFEDNCASADNDTIRITIKFNNNTGEITTAEVMLLFNKTKENDWSIANMSVTASWNGNSYFSYMDLDPNFWAPMNYSYHCGSQSFMYDSYNIDNSETYKIGVSFGNIQVQPFGAVKDGVFGDAFDCVGFFTIAIWMTILVGAILIITLGYGINMIMNINTMDRFDDPKGKTISINAVE